MAKSDRRQPLAPVLAQILEQLRQQGVDPETLCGADAQGARVKVVCVAPTLGDSVERLGRAARDQVVMVRMDEDSIQKLDAWVQTGAVHSRSQAAALFIREGLAVRESELTALKDTIRGVEEAKQRLRDKAREVLGTKDDAE